MAGKASAGASSFLSMWRRRVTKSALILLSAATFVAGVSFVATPADAQIAVFPARPKPLKPPQQQRPNGEKAPMMLPMPPSTTPAYMTMTYSTPTKG